ncbi:MAG: hypothetical protein LBS60_05455 [Deltaproteobacteria bacterium]|jgi:hypothetical protein|nr:hypothetical protein [Deltaproteobacteria bacterium]
MRDDKSFGRCDVKLKGFTRPPLGLVDYSCPSSTIYENGQKVDLEWCPLPEDHQGFGQIESYHGSNGKDYYNLGDLHALLGHIKNMDQRFITLDELKPWVARLIKLFLETPSGTVF